MKKAKEKILYIVYLLFIVLLFYFFTIAYRTNKIYNFIKSDSIGWKGHVHEADKELGFKPLPNSRGVITFSLYPGDSIPVKYDESGFRIPVWQKSTNSVKRPLLLFIGCSFTFGYACLAEDTFSYLVGKYLNCTSLNAGVCSYGLSQMTILASKLIPKYKPDYVIVQYSPWLIDRVIQPIPWLVNLNIGVYAPIYIGAIPIPYFATVNNKNKIIFPQFQTKVFGLSIDKYKNSEKNFSDYLSFLRDIGIPLHIYDDYQKFVTSIKMTLNIIPKPINNRENVEEYGYKEIYKVCEENNSKMVLLVLGNRYYNKCYLNLTKNLKNIKIANADYALWHNIPKNERGAERYNEEYKHFSGNPPVLVDGHLNPKAHKIVAKVLCEAIAEGKQFSLN